MAETDLESIWLFTLEHWSLEQADFYYQDLVSTFEGLASGLKKGRFVDVAPNFKKYLHQSHVIYFVEHDAYLDIIRILHQREDVISSKFS
jgi:toxin ParE1/3/4